MEEKKDSLEIPFVAHEASMQRMERANRRLWILVILLIVAFVIHVLLPTEVIDEENQEADADNGSNITQKIEK